MPRPALRSTTLKKIKKKIPGGAVVIRYFRRRPSKPKCAVCKKPLSGVPRKRPSQVKKLSKNKRRPNRPYGGNLCPKCTRNTMKRRR